MKRRLVILGGIGLFFILALIVCSCGGSSGGIVNGPTPTPTPMPTPITDGEPPEYITWISPGKVNIGNFYPGAQAEYPVSIHNGNEYSLDFDISYRFPDHVDSGWYKTVEFTYECPKCWELEDYGCSINKTETPYHWDCPNEEELRQSYCILGAEENIAACINWVTSMAYLCDRSPSRVTEAYITGQQAIISCQGSFGSPELQYLCPDCSNWVVIADESPILMPYETREVLVVLSMPSYAHAPYQWEYWVSVIEGGQTGMVKTELCSRWLVSMR